jgi:hypothetical protein
MTTTSSIAELQSAGVKLDVVEAVAIAQQLIQSFRGTGAPANLEPPYGPPTAATVVLGADGTVSCPGCGSTPAISEVAIFLETLLPPGTSRVPGALRYTIARALLEVDVAPFDSLDAFSESLARHACGDSAEVVRRLVQRSESACALAAVLQADRRRPRATATDLRRALREADAQLYAHQARLPEPPPPAPASRKAMPAIAACLGAGMMLIAAGELMQRSAAPTAAAAPIVAPASLSGKSVPAPHPADATDRSSVPSPVSTLGDGSVSDTAALSRKGDPAPSGARAASPEQVPRAASPRASRATAKVKKTVTERRGVLDHLRLRWLTKRFAFRVEEL